MTTELVTSTTLSPADAKALVQSLDATHGIPEEAIRRCQQNRELVTPFLMRAIEQAGARLRAGEDLENDAGWLSLYLLWEFRVTEALPLLLEIASSDIGHDLFGDSIFEDFPQILATLAADNLQVIDDFIANPAHESYSRAAVAESYEYLVRDGILTRAEAVGRLARHLQNQFDQKHDAFASFLLCTLCDLHPREELEVIREAFARQVIDESIISWGSVERSLRGGDEEFQQRQSRLEPTQLADTVELLRDWHCFQPAPAPSDIRYLPPLRGINDDVSLNDFEMVHDHLDASPWDETTHVRSSTTIRNEAPRIGRNDLCPCGSGKKYKKCCQRSER